MVKRSTPELSLTAQLQIADTWVYFLGKKTAQTDRSHYSVPSTVTSSSRMTKISYSISTIPTFNLPTARHFPLWLALVLRLLSSSYQVCNQYRLLNLHPN
jgi:hypothetical protein